jgi:hypothetical protein
MINEALNKYKSLVYIIFNLVRHEFKFRQMHLVMLDSFLGFTILRDFFRINRAPCRVLGN